MTKPKALKSGCESADDGMILKKRRMCEVRKEEGFSGENKRVDILRNWRIKERGPLPLSLMNRAF